MDGARYVFGPLPSRRLGRSLGVDIIPRKLCTLDCLYCELGPTDKRGLRRKEYVSPSVVLPEIQSAISRGGVDYITFSGSGEPTLNSSLGSMIRSVKSMTAIPVAVITNGTLLFLEEVRNDLLKADVVLPSLDAATDAAFERLDRPHAHLRLAEIIEGLKRFRKEYDGTILLEVFLAKGINDSENDILALEETIAEIHPDRVQLNTVVRPPAYPSAIAVDPERLEEIRALFGPTCEIIAPGKQSRSAGAGPDTEVLLETIQRRPLSVKEIAVMFEKSEDQALRWLDGLEKNGVVHPSVFGGTKFYKHATRQH
ncbi:MAG TPA: radical SAM protein [Bacteroidota bacterium]